MNRTPHQRAVAKYKETRRAAGRCVTCGKKRGRRSDFCAKHARMANAVAAVRNRARRARRRPIPASPKFVDKTGQRFGSIVVLWYAGGDRKGQNPRWMVKCDCGVRKLMIGGSLVPGVDRRCSRCKGANYGKAPAANPLVTCACGCGQQFEQFAPSDPWQKKPREFISGHRPGIAHRAWTVKDDEQLRSLYRTMSVDDVAARLNRSVAMVRERASTIGWASSFDGTGQSDQESFEAAAKRVRRNRRSVAQALTFAGIPFGRVKGAKGERATNVRIKVSDVDRALAVFAAVLEKRPFKTEPWTKEEDDIVREKYKASGDVKISLALWRDVNSVTSRAKALGVQEKRGTPSGDKVIAALGILPVHRQELARLTGMPVYQVSSVLQSLRRAGKARTLGDGRWLGPDAIFSTAAGG